MAQPSLRVFICLQHIDGHVVRAEEERHDPAFIRGILKGNDEYQEATGEILLFDTMSWSQ